LTYSNIERRIATDFVAPFFTDFCGTDAAATPANCGRSWTLNYVIPGGKTVTAAPLRGGLWDLDSAQAENQVGLYLVDGGGVLTGRSVRPPRCYMEARVGEHPGASRTAAQNSG
jgi:hypothetical protein